MKCSYKIKNLDCANCAKKLEEYLNKDSKLNNVNINFSTLKITYETDIDNSLKYVNKLANEIEPSVVIYDSDIVSENYIYSYITLVLGVILGVIGILIDIPYYINYMFVILGFTLLIKRTFKIAIKLLLKNKSIDENLLVLISTIGAFLINERLEGLMVITLYELGKILESMAVNRTRKSISSLIEIREDYANLKDEKGYTKVSSKSIKMGDVIVVKEGERVPLDGIILKGSSEIDTSSITGESKLLSVTVNDRVLSGSINMNGLIEIKVDTLYENSTVSKILNLVENATEKKAKTETIVSKYAKYYTLIVLILAISLGVFLPFISSFTYDESIYKALTFLVISCPCAVAISVPLSYFSGLGLASNKGILVKGSNYLDGIRNISKIIFDKTGTITTGNFSISKINILDKEYSEKEILKLFVLGETFSNHPIAKSLIKEINMNVDTKEISKYKELSGLGIQYNINKDIIKIGNAKLVGLKEKVDNTVIYLSYNDKIIGNIIIEDTIKKEAKDIITKLNNMSIVTEMFTGDNEEVAKKICKQVGINEYKCNMLPVDKYNEMSNILENKKDNKLVAFVGDGINDAPVLALSDIGISMGGIGTEAAIETSDVVIMNDNLNNIVEAIHISKRINRVIKQNIIFAITTKVSILVLSIIGIASMWQAVFADVGVTIIAILNTLKETIINKGERGNKNEKNK